MGNPSDKGSGLGSAVQWCFYVSVIASCGYSFVRQQRLEQRLRLLEEHHFQLEETVFSFHEPQEDVLTRKARDVTDCICPSEITLQRKWKGIRGCFTRELRRQGNVKAGIDPGVRKSEYTHFQQMQFLRNVVTRRPGNNEHLYYEEPTTPPAIIKQENSNDGDNSSSKLDDDDHEDYCQLEDAQSDFSKLEEINVEFDRTDPLRDVERLKAKKPRYDSMTDDDDLLFLLSMLKTLKRVPVKKKMATKMNIMAVLDEATKDVEV